MPLLRLRWDSAEYHVGAKRSDPAVETSHDPLGVSQEPALEIYLHLITACLALVESDPCFQVDHAARDFATLPLPA